MCVFTILRFAPQKTPNSNIALKHILDFQPPIDFKEILSYLVFWICWVTFFGMVFGLSSRNVCSGISGGDLRTSPPSLQPFQGLLGQVKHQHEVARKDTWCFQLFFKCSPWNPGKMIQCDEHVFQNGYRLKPQTSTNYSFNVDWSCWSLNHTTVSITHLEDHPS